MYSVWALLTSNSSSVIQDCTFLKVKMSNTRFITIFGIIACIHGGLVASTDCGTVIYRGFLTNSTFHRIKLDIPPTGQLMITYTITFPHSDTTNPILLFETTDAIQDHSSLDPVRLCYKGLKTIRNTGYFISLAKWNSEIVCELRGDNRVCSGSSRYNTVTKSEWWFEIGFECGIAEIIDFDVHMELKCSFPISCQELYNDYCKKAGYYNLTSFPNTLGLTSQIEINKIISLLLIIYEDNIICYQHLMKFMCYSFLPKCQQAQVIIPCKKMCEETVAGCHDLIRHYDYHIYCSAYPQSLDPELCYYEPIICPKPELPTSGLLMSIGRGVHNITTYSCDDGFELAGIRQRQCLYNGTWSGTRPVCKMITTTKRNIIIALSISGGIVVLLVLTVFLCIRFKSEFNLIHHHRRPGHVANGPAQGMLFVSYCSENRDVVENFLETIKVELPGFDVITYAECFDGGQDLNACMDKVVWESTSTIVLLTRAYTLSAYCRYEFMQCQTRAAIDQTFRFITVLFDETENYIDDIPDAMKHVMKYRIYLKVGEALFWNRLRRGLKVTQNEERHAL